jgi:hypothetical protein
MNQKESEKIKSLKDEIHHLKEYLVSDCCKQCSDIINKIEQHQQEIQKLQEKMNLE